MKQKEHISDWAVDQAEIERLTQKLNGIRELAEDRMREIKTLWAEIERLKKHLERCDRGRKDRQEVIDNQDTEIERLEDLLMVYADPTEMSDDDAKLMSEIYQRFEKRQ